MFNYKTLQSNTAHAETRCLVFRNFMVFPQHSQPRPSAVRGDEMLWELIEMELKCSVFLNVSAEVKFKRDSGH